MYPTPHLPLLKSFSGYIRGCLAGYSPQQGPQIKHNSQLLGCVSFFQSTES